MNDDKKENKENPYPLKEDGKEYSTKSADKHRKFENKSLNQ